MLAGVALLLLAAASLLLSLGREIDYDEAIYLSIAKSIDRTGLPLLAGLEDPGRKELFLVSPPLVMATAAVTQHAWPAEVFPSRLAHVVLFSLPVYVLVWLIARREYGEWPACVALVTLLASSQFLAHGGPVRLDVPLALFSLGALWCFHRATEPASAAGRWSAMAGLCLGTAVLVKYQAICVPLGIGFYLAWLALRRDRETLRRTVLPLVAQTVAGLAALAALAGYFCFAPPSGIPHYGSGVVGTFDRLAGSDVAPMSEAVCLAIVVLFGFKFLGWIVVPAAMAAVPGKPPSRFSTLLGCYCLAVVLFNLWARKMPGAGEYYLLPMIPPLAILAARGAAVAAGLPGKSRSLAVTGIIVVSLAWQFRDARPWQVPLAGRSGSRFARVAEYLRQAPEGGVLAENMALDFLTDRPTGMWEYMPYAALRDCLAGDGPCPISHVVLRRSWLDRPPQALARHWSEVLDLLERDYEPVPAGVEGMAVFARKAAAGSVSPTSSTARCTTGP